MEDPSRRTIVYGPVLLVYSLVLFKVGKRHVVEYMAFIEFC